MTSRLHLHALAGCTPTPLAHYLKALGVLRLVAEQADAAARGFWRDGVFRLATVLDLEELLAFFLERYSPTPLIAPWNAGSGFYYREQKVKVSGKRAGRKKGVRDQPTSATRAVEAMTKTSDPRFSEYREAIDWARSRQLAEGRECAPAPGLDKFDFVRRLRSQAPSAVRDWIGACMVLAPEELRFPSLMGSGGNEGNSDFASTFIQQLLNLFDRAAAPSCSSCTPLLHSCLFAAPTEGLERTFTSAHFAPGATGGDNSSTGFKGKWLANSWDYVLMLEGSLVFQSAAVRRLDGHGLPHASAPFAVRGQASGYASASSTDESNGGEQWLPLWDRPATYAEVRALFLEGRMQVGGRRAERALDAARAVAGLGVARGITAFERYGFIERNGQSNLAVPLGRWPIEDKPRARLLGEIDDWVERLRRAAGGKTAPVAFERAARRIERAIFAVCRAKTSAGWQALVAALGETEDMLARRPKSTAESFLRPLPPLSPAWLDLLDDGSAELSLAAAIASQATPRWLTRAGRDHDLGPIRVHCLPIERPRGFWMFATTEAGLAKSPRVVWTGRDLVSDLAAVALRRAVEAGQEGASRFPLQGCVVAHLSDLDRFVFGEVDDSKISRLARGLMAVDWPSAPGGYGSPARAERLGSEPWRPVAHLVALFKALYAPVDASARSGAPRELVERTPPLDVAPLRLLLAGHISAASRRAAARLRGSGAATKFEIVSGSGDLARRLAAAVAIPLSLDDHTKLLRGVRRAGRTTKAELESHT